MIYTDLLTTDKDPMGTAILDYLEHGKADKLRVFSSQFDEDEIPVRTLFRTENRWPHWNGQPCNSLPVASSM